MPRYEYWKNFILHAGEFFYGFDSIQFILQEALQRKGPSSQVLFLIFSFIFTDTSIFVLFVTDLWFVLFKSHRCAPASSAENALRKSAMDGMESPQQQRWKELKIHPWTMMPSYLHPLWGFTRICQSAASSPPPILLAILTFHFFPIV
jgi:hypothetical protein